MSYTWLSDAELLRIAEDSDSDLVRELAGRFERLIMHREELFVGREIPRAHIEGR